MFEKLFAKSGFSLDRLINFCEVAEKGSIVGVASGDLSRQSLISRQIKELEEFFEVELIRRKGRGLELTEEGRELAALGRQHFKNLADFSSRLQSGPWTADLITSNSVAQWQLLPRLKKVLAAHPELRLHIHHGQTEEMISQLRDGMMDLAILRKDARVEAFETAPWGDMTFALYLPKSLVAKRPASYASALTSAPLALPLGGGLRSWVEASADEKKSPLQVNVSCTSYLQALPLVQAELCGAVLPEAAGASLPKGKFHSWTLPFSYPLVLAWTKRNAQTRPQLIRLIKSLS
jgi:DNA-binding transcriptional LysR family regulator